MAFILPVETAVGDAQSIDLVKLRPLRPFIFGPLAGLHRFSIASEKTGILAGAYDPDLQKVFSYPDKTAGSDIDLTYTKVWFDDALLNYFNDYIGQGGTVAPVSGTYNNRVRDTGFVFKTGNGFSRSSVFNDRDVTVGDVVWVKSGATELRTTVRELVADATAASVGAAAGDANNKATQVLSVVTTQVAGTPVNCVAAVANGTAYNSIADGYITRTYTITATTGSTGGNATTARLSVRSADGLESQDDVIPAAFASPSTIGTKGLTVTFANTLSASCSSAASVSGILPADFVVGQQWTVTVNQAFTAPAATISGTYTGDTSTTYIVTLSRGGNVGDTDPPQITVSTTTGVDSSGPTDVIATATDVVVGTQGIVVQFNLANLRKGDIYYSVVVGTGAGTIRTIVLNNDLPAALQSATDLDLRLFIEKDGLSIARQRSYPNIGVNWAATATSVTTEPNFYSYDSTWTSGSTQLPLKVTSAAVYIEYREWTYTLADTVYDADDVTNLPTNLGTIHPDNPLGYAVFKALQNTAGALLVSPSPQAAANTDVVRYAAVGGDPDDIDNWTEVLQLVEGLEDIYYLVPLTADTAIQDAVAAHCDAQSVAGVSSYRACFLQATADSAAVVVDDTNTTDETPALATIAQDPGTSSTAFTYLRVPAGNAEFITNGVVAGDTVRYLFTPDAFGNPSYSTYTVASVLSEDALLLETGPSQSHATAQQVEVWRTRTRDQITAALTERAAELASSRAVLVWPDTISTIDGTVAGYHACAALAGLAGSVPSQQPLRFVELAGFTGAPRSRDYLTRAQLDELSSGSGVWVLNAASDGTVYTYYATTTDPTTLQTREEMVRRNADMFAYALLDKWATHLGTTNINDYVLGMMRSQFLTLREELRASAMVPRLGPPIYDASLDDLKQHETLADHLVAIVTIIGPTPNNKIELTVIAS